MSLGYRFVLEGSAFRFLSSCKAGDRRLLDRTFSELEANPFRGGDFQETDKEGRTVEVTVRGTFAITYWADHAVKELRLVRIEKEEL